MAPTGEMMSETPSVEANPVEGLPATGGNPETMVAPFVEAEDQIIVGSSVTVPDVGSVGPGWIVIHADNNGAPGAILGETAVSDGDNPDVVVNIDVSKATNILWAMLHTDAGTVGTFEFPGPDAPVTQNSSVVMQSFTAAMR